MSERTVRDAYEVFCEVFHSDMKWETFRRKHLNNPQRVEDMAVFVDYAEDGTARGTNSFLGCILCSPAGARTATFSCDTAVRPECRGQHIFSNLIRQAIVEHRQQGIDLICAVPNQNSYPGFLKLGFCELGQLGRYMRFLRPVSFLRQRMLRKPVKAPTFSPETGTDAKGIAYRVSLECPFSHTDIQKMNEQSGIHLKRSVEAFRWRVSSIESGRVAYIRVTTGEKMAAYFVVVLRQSGICELIDWDVFEENLLRPAFKILVRYLRRYGNMISVGCVNIKGQDAAVLARAGFCKDSRSGVPFLIYDPKEKDYCGLWEFQKCENWKLRTIDMDTILNGIR